MWAIWWCHFCAMLLHPIWVVFGGRIPPANQMARMKHKTVPNWELVSIRCCRMDFAAITTKIANGKNMLLQHFIYANAPYMQVQHTESLIDHFLIYVLWNVCRGVYFIKRKHDECSIPPPPEDFITVLVCIGGKAIWNTPVLSNLGNWARSILEKETTKKSLAEKGKPPVLLAWKILAGVAINWQQPDWLLHSHTHACTHAQTHTHMCLKYENILM